MVASHEDPRLFAKLVDRQRSKCRSTPGEINFSGQMSGSEATVAWAYYFEQLATPKDSPEYNSSYKCTVEAMMNSLNIIFFSIVK